MNNYTIEIKKGDSWSNDKPYISVYCLETDGYNSEMLKIADYGSGYSVGTSATLSGTLAQCELRARAYRIAFAMLSDLIEGIVKVGDKHIITIDKDFLNY